MYHIIFPMLSDRDAGETTRLESTIGYPTGSVFGSVSGHSTGETLARFRS